MSSLDRIPIFVNCNTRLLARGKSNAKGVFHLSWNDDENTRKPFLFYCILQKDTLLLARVQTIPSDDADLTFVLPR
jgi:hypothetical protein